jgi:Cu(I)/Ag(I) efflux system membrane fusion protein
MNKATFLLAIATLAVGLGLGYVLFAQPSVLSSAASSATSSAESNQERELLFYRNPMNPAITSPAPAKDSMGMDYVPVYAEDSTAGDVAGTVQIDPVVVQNIGVRTAIAERRALSRSIRTVGRVDFNEERIARLHPKVEGWIEEIRVDKTGQHVEPDDILLSLYSPRLVSAQQEYLLALGNQDALENSPFKRISSGAKDLTQSARERLQLLDVPEHQIHELEQTHEIKKYIHIHAPWAGTVIRIGARAGQFVTPSTELYMMVDLEKVWVYADVYEYEVPWVEVGDEVEMTLASVPGKTFSGALQYVYPYAESKTRTTKVRIVFDNADRLLRPDMFAEVTISTDTQEDAIVIPAEAVVRSDHRTQAFVVRAPGKFEPRDIRTGIESGGLVTVLEGVLVGEEVVTSAQFLVDSESKLREATAKMMEVRTSGDVPDASGAMNHEDQSTDVSPEQSEENGHD